MNPIPVARITKTLEGNRHLGDPAVLDNPGRRVIQGVPGHVAAHSPSGTHHGIALHAVRVHGECVCALHIEKWIQVKSDFVVGLDLIAVDPARPNLGRIRIVGVDPEVELVFCIRDVDNRLLRGRRPFYSPPRTLKKLGNSRRCAPRQIVQPTIDDRRFLNPNRSSCRTSGHGRWNLRRDRLTRRARLALCDRIILGKRERWRKSG